MRVPRCLLLFAWCATIGASLAQTVSKSEDERGARLLERYQAMLMANPVEGLPLDRIWQAYQDRGAAAELLESYRTAADMPQAPAATALVYGHLLKKAGKLDEAASAYERAGKLDPASPLPPYAAAELAALRSRPQDAAENYALAVARLRDADPRKTEWRSKLGAAWLAAGQPLKAVESWEKLVDSNPLDLELHRRLAETYEQNHLPQKAIAHDEFIEAHGQPPEQALALRSLGHLHEIRGEFDAARDALERGITLTARDNWLHRDLLTRLIRLYQRADRVPELATRWRAAAAKNPRDLDVCQQLAALAEAQGDVAGERDALEKMVSLLPGDRDSKLKLARLCAAAGDGARAAALFDDLLKLQPNSLDLVLERAALDVQLRQPEMAVRRIEAQIERNLSDESVVMPALDFFLAHHLDEAAEKWLRAEVALFPADAKPALALGKFLLARRRVADARVAFDAMAAGANDPAIRSVRWTQAAECFLAQNMSEDALLCWQRAATLQPAAAEPLLAQAEIWLARGDPAQAADLFKCAVEATPAGPDRLDRERKLFDALQATDNLNGSSAQQAPGGFAVAQKSGESCPGKRTAQYLSTLAETARTASTAENNLRLARWQTWAHLEEQAYASAAKAVELDPKQVAARELLVGISTKQGKWEEAERQLREIVAVDPARRNPCLHRIAQLKLDAGETDEAIGILTQLQEDQPGSRAALTDLALALERADRWYDALATWEQAYALPGLTPAQRDEIRRPLVLASEHLEQFSRAVEALKDAVNERADVAAKEEAFGRLQDFCRKHDLSAQLLAEYEARLVAQPDDDCALIFLSRLRKESGQERESYRLLAQAYYIAPDPVRALRRLVDAAQEIGEGDEAWAWQRRLIALPGQSTAENIGRLATLEEASLDGDAAACTWESIVARFPRDSTALKKAADFFERADDMGRVQSLLTQFCVLDAADLTQAIRLARLQARAADLTSALASYEHVIDGTETEKPGEPWRWPTELASAKMADAFKLGASISRRSGLTGNPPTAAPASASSDDRLWRLTAIRETSALLFPAGKGSSKALEADLRRRWLDRWRQAAAAGARSEPLTTFFYAGEASLTMDLLSGWLATGPGSVDGAVETAFLNAGLRFGEYRRLAAWAWGTADPAHRDHRSRQLLDALGQFLSANGETRPELVAELFPSSLRVREFLWTAARDVFASHHRYAEATELGDRVLAQMVSGRTAYAIQVAEWDLYLGQVDRARSALRLVIEEGGGVTLDASIDPTFAALRAYYLLLPAEQRSDFIEVYLRRAQVQGNIVHSTLAATLLHGLADDPPAVRSDLDALLALRLTTTESSGSSPDARRWAYLLATGQQLRGWNLDWMAEHLWRMAWQQAGAFDRQQFESGGQLAEIRRGLLSVQVALAESPQHALESAQAFLSDGLTDGTVARAAEQLAAESQQPAAQWLSECLCRRTPSNPDHWRRLFSIYTDTQQGDALETTLAAWYDGTQTRPDGIDPTELCGRLATVRESNGDPSGAIRLLEKARQAVPGNLAILRQLAQADERAARWMAAADIWREALPLDAEGVSRLGLAAVEEHLGHREEAASLLTAGVTAGPVAARTEAAVRWVQLSLSCGRAEQARRFALDLVRDRKLEALPRIAAAFSAGGGLSLAEEILTAGIRRTQDDTERFQLQRVLVQQWSASGGDQTGFERQMRRLKRLGSVLPALGQEYAQELCAQARTAKSGAWVETELRRNWSGGQGEAWAGVALVDVYLRSHQQSALRETVATLECSSGLDESALGSLERVLKDPEPSLALGFAERLFARAPQNESAALNQAELLWRCGRRTEADTFLETREAASIFSSTMTMAVANLYLRLGDKGLARRYFERAAERDPAAVHAPQAYLHLARLNLEGGRLSEAERLLRIAYRQPACEDLTPLVDDLIARDDPSRNDGVPAGNFPMSFDRRARLLMMIRDWWIQSGSFANAELLLNHYPEYLWAVPERISELVSHETLAGMPGLAAALEKALVWEDSGGASLKRGLAALYVRWAGEALKSGQNAEVAIARLTRARDLQPDDFSIAKRLAELCCDQGRGAQANDVLARFSGADGLPVERAEANRVLSHR